MSKSTKHFTAFMAMILSITLILGIVPAMPKVFANPDDSMIWFVPDEQHQVIHSADGTAWWGAAWGYKTTFSENGLHFETKFPGTAVRTGYTQTFDLDGLTFAFDNLNNEQSKAVITMLMSATTFYTFDPAFSGNNNTLDIVLDTVNGKITFEDGTVLLENDALKYANITDKAFTVTFNKDNDGYKVTVDIEGTAITGTTAFSSAMIAAHSDITDEGHVVIGVAGGAGSEGLTSFDLNKIGGARKASIKGENSLTASNFAIPVANNFWPDRLALRDAPTGGARMIFFNSGITNVRNGPWTPAKLDGMYLKVNNISVIGASNPKNLPEIAFVFTDKDAYDGWNAASNMLALVLDTRNGKLRFSSDGKFLEETHVIITDETLKYENIAQREVILRTFKNDDGSYKVQIEIDGKEPLFGTLPASCIESASLLSDPDNAKLVITPAIPEGEGMPGKAEFMIDLVEYFATPEGELDAPDSTDDPDITRIPGVTYLDTSQLKIYGSDNSEIIGTKEAWAQSGGLIVTNLKTGVRMAFSNAVAVGHREGYYKKIALDRTEFTFRRLKGGDFGLVFGNQDNIYPISFGANTLLLAYSASEQKIYAKTNDGITANVITGLAPKVLEDDLFTYYFEENEDGGYTLKVTAGDNNYSGTIPADVITASGVDDFGAVEMSINPVTTGDSFTIDFIGIRRLEVGDPDIDPIDGVIYLNKSLLKIHSNPNQHEQDTIKNWTGAGLIAAKDLKKGVRFNFNTTEANVREGYKEAMNLKGLQLHFRSFQGTGFGITIADTGSSYPPEFSASARGLAIRYDAARKLIYAATIDEAGVITETELIQDISLPADTYFTYTFAINADRGYDFIVDVDDTEYKGVIPKAVLDQAKTITNATEIEVSLNSGGFTSTQIDYIGVRQLTLVDAAAVADVIHVIDAIGDISLENGTPIRTARKLYEQLNKEEKETVINYDDLLKAEEAYHELATEADRPLTYLDISNSRHAGSTSEAIQQTVFKDWANNFHVSNIPTGGLCLEFINAVTGHREGYNKKVDMSDLLLQFDNLDAAYAENCKFAVLFGKDSGFYGIEYNPANPPLALVLDTAAGTITAYPREHVIIQSDYLKLENLKGKRFSYQLATRGEDEGYDLTVRVAGQELKGTIAYEDVAAATLLTSQTGCSIMVCPWGEATATCTFSLDFIGICQTSLLKKVENVTALIAALPEIIAEGDIDAVKEALANYQALPRSLRALVDNYNKLEKAIAQVYELEKEDTSWSDETPPGKTGDHQDSENLQTGVGFRYVWLLLSAFSLTVIAGTVLFKKKRSLMCVAFQKGGRK